METIKPILEVIRTLRGRNGCAWDQKQTPLTLWKCLAEELYELEEGLVKDDGENVCEELGDVLFQVLFIMEIFHDQGRIPFSRVVDGITRKMIRRHPHVYETAIVRTEEDLNRQWDRIKAREKRQKINETACSVQNGRTEDAENGPEGACRPPFSALDNVPSGMPGLLRAMKVSKCAVKEGFDWDDMAGVMDKVKEEIQEFEAAVKEGDQDGAAVEFGDILFTLVNVARFAGFHPETALNLSTAKFESRFRFMETLLGRENLDLKSLSQEEKERFWNKAKKGDHKPCG